MVSRLIEEKDIGSFDSELGEDDSVPQSIGKVGDGRSLVRSRDTESTDARPPVLSILVGEFVVELLLEVFEGRKVVRELIGRVLRVFAEFESRVSLNGTGDGLKVGGNQVEEGRLSSSVLTDDSDTGVHTVKAQV
jgi:hypothetical protein